MNIVYLLRSKQNPNRVYTGLCKNLKNRLAQHNAGECLTALPTSVSLLKTARFKSILPKVATCK